MKAYRLTKLGRPKPLDAEGARQYGGRFNSPGVPMLYLSTSVAPAMLEVRVHSPVPHPNQRLVHVIEVPDDRIQTLAQLGFALPANWDAKPHDPALTPPLGDQWVSSGASLVMLVPSAVSPEDSNLLINPQHPEFSEIKVLSSTPRNLDARLWDYSMPQ